MDDDGVRMLGVGSGVDGADMGNGERVSLLW